MTNKEISKRIKEIREDSKLNQEDFAKRLGLKGRSHISMVENNQRVATDRFIHQISKEFSVSEEWIKTGSGNKYLSTPHPETTRKMIELFETLDRNKQEAVIQLIKSISNDNN